MSMTDQTETYYCYIYYRADGITPFYIGKGTYQRAYKFSGHGKWCRNIIQHDGKENIKVELIECKDEQEAFYQERILITQLRMFYKLCNLTDGGEGSSGYRAPLEVRKKMSVAHMGEKNHNYGKPCPNEQKKKISEALTGRSNPHTPEQNRKIGEAQKGKVILQETKELLSTIHKGKHYSIETEFKKGVENPNYGKEFSEETREKMSAWQIGRQLSKETKKKLSEANKGKNSSMFEKEHSEETKQNMAEAARKRWAIKNNAFLSEKEKYIQLEELKRISKEASNLKKKEQKREAYQKKREKKISEE
jgi:hypothetical protein